MADPSLSDGTAAVAQSFVGAALTRLFEETDDARMLIGADGAILLVNRAWESLLGWGRDEVVGRTGQVLAPDDFADAYVRLRSLLFKATDTRAIRFNVRARHRAGRTVPVRVTARLIEVDAGTRLLSLVLVPRTDGDADRHFRNLLEAAPDGKILVDGDGRIIMTNSRTGEMFGYAEGELLHASIEVLVPEARQEAHAALRGRFNGQARRHTMGLGTRVTARRKDGSAFPVMVVLSSLVTAEGLLVSATVRDITEQELQRESATEMRDQFLATVSHELRTPLTAVLAGLELLMDEIDEIDDPVRRARMVGLAGKVLRGARREMSLVEDLLTITALDTTGAAGKDALSDLQVVAENVVAAHAAEAAAAGLTLSAHLDQLPAFVHADESWLGRAVDCLVSNAVKFTPEGGVVTVGVGVDGSHAWLDVRDTGPGIPAGLEEKVFERLYRGDAAVAAESQGAGLGLTIARSIVESAGGSVAVVTGEPGAHLLVRFPRADA